MTDAVVIGAGLAGLSCALSLEAAGVSVTLLEAGDAPGGRVRTDLIEGFRLDRGFQVLLTAYPEAKRLLDYPALQLKQFEPGALVWHGGKFHRFADPFRNPMGAARFLFDSIVPLADKLHVAKLRARVQRGTWEEIFARTERTTRDYLQAVPFSADIIERFFEPFFAGVFLEPELVTSSRFFEFLFRIFSLGDTAVPAAGMQQIPLQLAAKLRPGTLRG
jgi:phytoene dehydrogenase-like protein